MRDFSWRCLALVAAVAIFSAACGDDSGTTSPDTPAPSSTAPSHTEGAHEEHSDTTTTVTSDDSETDVHQHTHGDTTTPAVEPYPSVSVRILEDPSGGWLLRSVPTNFRLAPENVSTEHIDGEGHMHLYVDGVKVMRLYGEWHEMTPLAAGVHEIRVEMSSNDHSAMAIDGTIVDDTVTLEVSADEATLVVDDSTDEVDSDEHDMSGIDAEDDGSMEEMNPAQTIAVEIVGGEPVGGHQRVEVDLNSEVALTVTSDLEVEVHVHGYDILHSVSLLANRCISVLLLKIPGVFEVELEGSGRLLLQLTVS